MPWKVNLNSLQHTGTEWVDHDGPGHVSVFQSVIVGAMGAAAPIHPVSVEREPTEPRVLTVSELLDLERANLAVH